MKIKKVIRKKLIQNIFANALLLLLFHCDSIRDIEPPSALFYLLGINQSGRIGVVSSDLGPAGRYTTMTLDGFSLTSNYTSIHSDAGAKYYNGKVYIINRLRRDNIQILNPKNANLTEGEFSTGSGTNPQDIAILRSDKAYISLYERNFIAIMNLNIGQIIGQISLAQFADEDLIPEASALHIEDSILYVFLQRLNRNSASSIFPPTDYSLIIAIDTNTDTVLQSYKTLGKNPSGTIKRVILNGDPYIIYATPGYQGYNFRLDGGIEKFNLRTKSVSNEFIYSEVVAGGDILDLEIKNESIGYAKVQYRDFGTAIQKFNLQSGEKLADIFYNPPSGGYVSGLVLAPNGYLYMGDANFTNPGISIFDTNSGDKKLNPSPISIGLRPTDIIYVPEE